MEQVGIDGSSGGSAPAPAPSAVPSGTPAPTAPIPSAPAPLAPRTSYTFEELKTLPLTELEKLRGHKVFDQTGTDRIVQERLARERASTQAVIGTMEQSYQQKLAELQGLQQQGAPMEQLQPFIQNLQQMQERMEMMDLEKQLELQRGKHADWEANEDDILKICVQYRLPLEQSYQLWRSQFIEKIDPEEMRKRHIDEYIKSKTGASAAAPRPEGQGGSGPVQTTQHDQTFETAEKRAKARLKNAGL